jgi:CDP-glucose 4,6-dehydratase
MKFNAFKNKKVLITGHTGFKGSWLSIWLLNLGANVAGLSNQVPTIPSLFEEAKLENKITHHVGDIRDLNTTIKVIKEFQPDFIFHFAAQSIVSKSYKDPIETISTNVLGTTILLEAIRSLDINVIALIITSDKCYKNVETFYGYKEMDILGGLDIYSASKASAEIIFHSYFHSFFKNKIANIRIATARAGNVIGGGDWSESRLIPDCMRSWSNGQPVKIRNPKSIRPWQHVLEPISGYLTLALKLLENEDLSGESFNFGPSSEEFYDVECVIKTLCKTWKLKVEEAYHVINDSTFYESSLLKLNCDKALHFLSWKATLSYDESLLLTGDWYYSFYRNKSDVFERTIDQISFYENKALERNLIWTS